MRYRTDDLPIKGMGAFLPTTFRNPIASSWGLVKVTALMGLQPVNSPKAAAVPPISAIRETQSTYVAPDVILPDQYVTYADNMGPSADAGVNMAGRRMTPIPVPAVSWINTAVQAMQASRTGGRGVLSWPRAFQRWPIIGSKNNQQG